MTTLFGDYNARFSDLETVGSTFVLRESEFKRICAPGNTLILGPRGSGKTTLLKMMKVSAQIASRSQGNFALLKSINYRPTYLAADRLFGPLTLGIDPSLPDYSPDLASLAMTLTAVRARFAFLDTLEEVTNPVLQDTPVASHQFVKMDREQEVQFCKILKTSWNIQGDVINLRELRAALSAKIDKINSLIFLCTSGALPNDAGLQASDLHTDVIGSSIAFIDAFEGAFPEARMQWALCVDELEIMPDFLQKYFFLNLRSTDHRLILKLATSPFTSAFADYNQASPMDGNDFTSVDLTSPKKKDSIKFTRQLVGELVKRAGLPRSTTPQELLGKSPVTEENSDQPGKKGPYSAPRGSHYQRFTKLAGMDPDFQDYLQRNEIDLNSLDSMEEQNRAAKARQAIWQVALRLEFGANQTFRTSQSKQKRRNPRKRVPPIYTGSDSIMTMCEGNPRITIGVFNELLTAFHSKGNKRVNSSQQSRIIESTTAKYLSLLSAIPAAIDRNARRSTSIVDLIEKISLVCGEENLVGAFSPEPLSTFVVDDRVPPDLVDSLGAAINQGAFVMIEDRNRMHSYGQLQGARLRMSYLLCSRYRLPLTYGRSISISRVLDHGSSSASEGQLRMADLFDF